jgi:hypothetical protein
MTVADRDRLFRKAVAGTHARFQTSTLLRDIKPSATQCWLQKRVQRRHDQASKLHKCCCHLATGGYCATECLMHASHSAQVTDPSVEYNLDHECVNFVVLKKHSYGLSAKPQ